MKDIFLTPHEVEGRIKSFQKKIEKKGLKGVVLSAESNVQYFSGYTNHAPWSTFTRPIFLFIPVSGKPVLYAQTFVEPEAKIVSFGCDVRKFDSLLGPTAKELQSIMYDLGIKDADVGFELGFEQRMGFQIDIFLELKSICKNETFKDAADIIWEQRIIKSKYEIQCIARACEATNYAHDNIYDYLKIGMSERDVARKVEQLMLDGGAEYPGFVIIAIGEGNYGRISKVSADRAIEKGDFIWLDLGARYNGYWSDFCRAGYAGEIKQSHQDLQKSVHDITMEAASSMKPGVPVADVARACADALKKRGHEATFDCGRMGHGMGLMSTEPPSVTIYDDTILQEGMIINLEPGIVNDEGVFCIEENFVITKDGFEMLTGGDRALRKVK